MMTHEQNQSDHPEMLMRTWELIDNLGKTIVITGMHAHIERHKYERDTGRKVVMMREVEE